MQINRGPVTNYVGTKASMEMAGIEPASKKLVIKECTSLGNLFQTTLDRNYQKPTVDRLFLLWNFSINEQKVLHPDCVSPNTSHQEKRVKEG